MSCLFESLCKSVNLHPLHLRLEICKYLSTDPILFDDLHASIIVNHQPDISTSTTNGKDSLSQYICEMSSPITMGGAIEIISFCKMFNKNVIVKHLNSNSKPIEFITDHSNHTIVITWNGGHFEPT
jgi:hypothetical protein